MIPKPLLPSFALNYSFHRKYRDLGNGKANYDGPTKQLVNKIQNLFKIKFEK